MNATNHIIQRQVFEVEMENPADAFGFRNQLAAVFHEQIMPGMEEIFNELGAGKTIRVDRLELDLGTINKSNWEQELKEKAMEKLKAMLQLQSPFLVDNAIFTKTSPTNKRVAENAADTEQTNHDLITTFISFLSTGRLPWHAKATLSFEKVFAEEVSEELVSALKIFLVTANSAAHTRLVYQLKESTLTELMTRLLMGVADDFVVDFKLAANYIKAAFRFLQVPEALYNKLLFLPFFSWYSSSGQEKLHTFYANAFAAGVQPDYPEIVQYVEIDKVPATFKHNPILQQIQTELTTVSIKKHLIDVPLQQPKIAADPYEDIYVENAGLVLLHPFLAPLFAQMQLVENGKFLNELAQMKGVLLAQYLVDGSTETEEHRLVLNKLLCGMPLENPVIKRLALTGAEKAEADDLLSQVIKLWTKNNVPVNNTIEGFQQSFLQRSGKLMQQNNSWLLQVEQQAFDMLLSSLPWGISIIKNSWMKGMLRVEWGL